MILRKFCDDFFEIGKIAILQKKTNNDVYDFDFRNHFECRSVVSESNNPVLLHVGAVGNYSEVVNALAKIGMKPLVSETEHLRCSTIENWYPLLKEKTQFTVVYYELPDLDVLLEHFSFPVFIKGNRQTNRHKKSQCIIENEDAYNRLRAEWKADDVLHWQKVAIREFVPLLAIDAESYPDQVPVSYEFRFFYFEGKCMGYGPYWYMGRRYSLGQDELKEVLRLTDWAAEKLGASFPAIDVAKTASGEWILIEVNDAQESGFVGINPLVLWNNTLDAMQNRTWIPVEEFFEEGTVIMGGDPLPEVSLEEMSRISASLRNAQELVDSFAGVSNKFWWVEDDVYDFEEGTAEYKLACEITDAWGALMDELEERLIRTAKEEGLMKEDEEHPNSKAALLPIMEKYGYRDINGWWVRKCND
ncbi:MAG: ATP-grasp domain-containing protein [Clostridiales bacterium]|nr:ATP-grasp domain-containing protein [Clostridiales bacterium]MDU1042768.1 ATP-grasp domain-containing protein [Clostridiales bacterium]